MVARAWTRMARWPNWREERVSCVCAVEGPTLTMRAVLQFPPSESWRMRVSFDVR